MAHARSSTEVLDFGFAFQPTALKDTNLELFADEFPREGDTSHSRTYNA
jgi:hypothetical protein